MKDFVIIISPSKMFNKNAKEYKNGPRPIFINEAGDIFSTIEKWGLKKVQRNYKISPKKAKEVVEMHKKHGEKLFRAIDLYDGLVFKQLHIDQYDLDWLNSHLIILDALYGIIKPLDLISPYRLDFHTITTKKLFKFWTKKINLYLKDKTIINLASKEFSQLVCKKMHVPNLPDREVKLHRGIILDKIIKSKGQNV